MSDGARMAYRILIKRRRKCIRAKAHTVGYCRACGVHQ